MRSTSVTHKPLASSFDYSTRATPTGFRPVRSAVIDLQGGLLLPTRLLVGVELMPCSNRRPGTRLLNGNQDPSAAHIFTFYVGAVDK